MRAILGYHSIDDSGSPLSLSEPELRGHLSCLASRKVQTVPLDWLAKVPDSRDALSLTFDDGYANFAESAWPLYRHNDLPVTLFVASARAGGTSDWGAPGKGPSLPLLGWDALSKLVEKGLVLGSMGRSHSDLTQVSDTQLAEELEGSAADIEQHTGVRPTAFSFPFGRSDARVRAAVAGHYALACGARLAVLDDGDEPHDLPRLDVRHYRSAAHLAAWGKGSFRRRLWLRSKLA